MNDTEQLTAPPAAAVAAARQTLGRQAKELARTAMDLEQLALLDEEPFEEALLWETDRIQKQYNGEHSKQIIWRRDAAAYMVRIGCPKEHICAVLRMNSRVVDALAARCVSSVAKFADEYAEQLLKLGAEMFAAAHLKKDEANTLQAATAGGILTDKAIAIKMLGGGLAAPETAIDVEEQDEELKRFREGLKQLNGAKVESRESRVESKDILT